MRDLAEEVRRTPRALNPNLLDHLEPSPTQMAKNAMEMQRIYKERKRSAKPVPFGNATR